MTLLAVERIKLFSTRSPWWCSALAVALVVGVTGLAAGTWTDDIGPFPIVLIPNFLPFGMIIVMVMAALSVTTEYRFGTIRATFQAVPNRTAALLAKTTVVALVAGVVGLAAAFGAWGLARLLRSEPGLALTTGAHWRAVAGAGLVFAVAAVLAVAVGILVRQTAGAVSVLLVWALLLENLVQIIPGIGADVQAWLPFTALMRFQIDGATPLPEGSPAPFAAPLGPWASLLYVAALAAALLTVALAAANRRDA